MHPSLSAFPSRHFYDAKLRDGVSAAQRPAPAFPFPAAAHPVAFLDVERGREEVTSGGWAGGCLSDPLGVHAWFLAACFVCMVSARLVQLGGLELVLGLLARWCALAWSAAWLSRPPTCCS
jgi:hypothetical protein